MEHAAALGQIAASWSIVEDYCGSIIQWLVDTEGEPGRAITAEMPLLQRVAVIGSLVHCIRDHKLLDHWEDICRIMDGLRVERNDMIHGEWQIYDGEKIITRTKAKGRVTVRWENIPTEHLINLEARIIELVDDLAWFSNQLARQGFKKALSAARTMPQLNRTQSPKALAQAQVREAKKARRQADRERSKNPPKS
jgi:hypothetical protein